MELWDVFEKRRTIRKFHRIRISSDTDQTTISLNIPLGQEK